MLEQEVVWHRGMGWTCSVGGAQELVVEKNLTLTRQVLIRWNHLEPSVCGGQGMRVMARHGELDCTLRKQRHLKRERWERCQRNSEERQEERYKPSIRDQSPKDRKDQCAHAPERPTGMSTDNIWPNRRLAVNSERIELLLDVEREGESREKSCRQ